MSRVLTEWLADDRDPYLVVHPSGQLDFEVRYPDRVAVFPGSFNPLHEGHRALQTTAGRYLRLPVYWEISALNVDKPPLDGPELARRLDQFGGTYDVVLLTKAARFEEKAALFRGTTFVVGFDTAARAVDPRYGDPARTLAEVERHGCRFLVAARVWQGHTRTLADVDVPPRWRRLFEDLPIYLLPGSETSSTAIRNGATA